MWPVLGKGVCSGLNWTAQLALKQCLVWFWFDHNQNLQPNRSQMKWDVWKPCSDQRWRDELRFSIWRFFELSDLVDNHLLCYWPTIHNLILKICPKFQVISFHFFEVNELLDEIEQKLCKVKKFQLQSMSNAIRCIDHRFAFKNSGFACLALIFNLS